MTNRADERAESATFHEQLAVLRRRKWIVGILAKTFAVMVGRAAV
jgi:hypothetical protein